MAAESVDVRLARLEGGYAQVSERLGAIEQRLSGLDARMEQRFASLEAKIEERFARSDARMDRQFSWVVGLVVLSLLIPIALQFVPVP